MDEFSSYRAGNEAARERRGMLGRNRLISNFIIKTNTRVHGYMGET